MHFYPEVDGEDLRHKSAAMLHPDATSTHTAANCLESDDTRHPGALNARSTSNVYNPEMKIVHKCIINSCSSSYITQMMPKMI